MANESCCEMCGKVFISAWTEAEAIAEKNRLFPDTKVEDCDLVCDPCFQGLKARYPAHFRE